MFTFDFETEAIQRRPHYPPRPVGLAFKKDGGRARYIGWGHPTKNNGTFEEARAVLAAAYASGDGLLCHNAKFDLEVAEVHMGLALPSWERIHDSMFLVFLEDPYARSFALKPSAERILGLPPAERDVVLEWLVEHNVVARNAKDWGAHICDAPGDLVGRYAVGDVDRTWKLYKALSRNDYMVEPYDRERQLLPILLRNEQRGMRVDLPLLQQDIESYLAQMSKADDWLRKRLKAPSCNLDAANEFADALERAGVVTEFKLTDNGNRSVAKDKLTLDLFKDKEVAYVYGYRQKLSTCLSTFMQPWEAMASATGGRIHTSWSQLKQTSSRGDDSGAKTGRLASSPNFQNIPKAFATGEDALGWEYPKRLKLRELPRIRGYVLPEAGEVFCHRDYAQQEIRILAHFEDGDLMRVFNMKKPPLEVCKDGRVDIHAYVGHEIQEQLGLKLSRYAVKTTNFGMLYGMGLAKLAYRLGTDEAHAAQIRSAQRKVLGGVATLEAELKYLGRSNQFITTSGGRRYYREPNDERDMSYKLLNYLIQGSAADCTKQALINMANHPKFDGALLVTVHDEINFSCPLRSVARNMKALREAMLDVKFDVPMISDPKTGPRWGELTTYKEK